MFRPLKINVLFLIRIKIIKGEGEKSFFFRDMVNATLNHVYIEWTETMLYNLRCNFDPLLIGLEICYKNWEKAVNLLFPARLMRHGSLFRKALD